MADEKQLPTDSPLDEWVLMQFHVQLYLDSHPMINGFRPAVAADSTGVTAEIRYGAHRLSAREESTGWWEPRTPARGQEIADHLARELYGKWLRCLGAWEWSEQPAHAAKPADPRASSK